MRPTRFLLAVLATLLVLPASAQDRGAAGKAVYDKTCALCHGTGLAGAPRFGNAAEWAPRLKAGAASLYRSALQGTPRGMPGKGGNLSLSDAEVRSAVDYMVAAAGGLPRGAAPPAAQERKPAAPPAEKPAEPAAAAAAPEPTASADVNAFNRLFAPGRRNLPPAEDGIHDPASLGTRLLQAPLQAFNPLPRSNAGNRVDWVAVLARNQAQPRWEIENPKAEPPVMDLNIVREVKGSMPDVVYPHKQHTQWLDCSNCHPAIFVPQKGANQISMAAILLGQKCGVCHGKVAFPVSECRLCHSGKKDLPAVRNAGASPGAVTP